MIESVFILCDDRLGHREQVATKRPADKIKVRIGNSSCIESFGHLPNVFFALDQNRGPHASYPTREDPLLIKPAEARHLSARLAEGRRTGIPTFSRPGGCGAFSGAMIPLHGGLYVGVSI